MLTIEKATLRREGFSDRFMRSVDRYSRIMGIAVILMAIVFIIIPFFAPTLSDFKKGFCVGTFIGTLAGITVTSICYMAKRGWK